MRRGAWRAGALKVEALADPKGLRKEEALGRTEGSVSLEGSEDHCQ